MEDTIDLLEKRIKALELQVLPQDNFDITQFLSSAKSKKSTVVDLCVDTHTMIQSALSCRESIAAIIKRADLINSYLSPLEYLDSCTLDGQEDLSKESRTKYIIELYNEVKMIIGYINEFKNLQKVLDKDLPQVLTSVDKLQELYIKNSDLYEECQDVKFQILKTLQDYNNLCQEISAAFAGYDQQLSIIEQSMVKKTCVDEDVL